MAPNNQKVIIKSSMIKPTQKSKRLFFKKLHLTYKQFLSRKKSLIGMKIGTYVVLEKIGQGSFGTVFCAIEEVSMRMVAVKLIDLEIIETQPNYQIKKIQRRLINSENQIMLKFSSGNLNLIKCYEVIQNLSLQIMVIQYCNQGTLQQKIDKIGRIQQPQAIKILEQILNGLIELHKNKIIHRDLKPQNILIHEGIYKIADFGFSKQLSSSDFQNEIIQTNLGTPGYMAPQVYNRKQYGLNADIWSIGVIFFTMLYGKNPFEKLSRKEIQAKVMSKSLFNAQSSIKISSQSMSFITNCLNLDSKNRLNWKSISNHKLLKLNINPFEFQEQDFTNQLRTTSVFDNQIFQTLNQTEITCDEESLKLENQEVSDIQIVKAILLNAEQFAKIQQKANKQIFVKDFSWPKLTNFKCLKAEFILQQIIEPLEFLPSKFSDTKEVTQTLYLLLARSLQDISENYWQRQRYKHKMIPGFMKILENLYKKIQNKFDFYRDKISKRNEELLKIIKDKIFEFFNENEKPEGTGVFFNCDKKNLEKGLTLGPYSKQDQIKHIQLCLNRQLKKISKQISIAKDVLKYAKNYSKIINIKLEDVGNAYFRAYVTNLFITQ